MSWSHGDFVKMWCWRFYEALDNHTVTKLSDTKSFKIRICHAIFYRWQRRIWEAKSNGVITFFVKIVWHEIRSLTFHISPTLKFKLNSNSVKKTLAKVHFQCLSIRFRQALLRFVFFFRSIFVPLRNISCHQCLGCELFRASPAVKESFLDCKIQEFETSLKVAWT